MELDMIFGTGHLTGNEDCGQPKVRVLTYPYDKSAKKLGRRDGTWDLHTSEANDLFIDPTSARA